MSYFDHPAINHSGLLLFKKSPLHYITKKTETPTPAMQLGSAIHCAVLEPSQFNKRYVYLDIDRRTKTGKEEFERLSIERIVLSQKNKETIEGVTTAVESSTFAKELLKNSIKEFPLFWNDELNGETCKAKPDAVNASAIIDLKTTESADKDSFSKSIFTFNYHTQACWYLDGYYQATGKVIDDFYFIAVEKEPPFALAIYEVKRNSRMMDEARITLRKLLDQYHYCKTNNKWDGYSAAPQSIDLPPWGYKEIFI